MVIKWQDKGCKSCRDLWKSGQRPQELAINYDLHSRLHKCKECGTYWEQHETPPDPKACGKEDCFDLTAPVKNLRQTTQPSFRLGVDEL